MKQTLKQGQMDAELMLEAKMKDLTTMRQKMIKLEAEEETKEALRR